MTNDWLELIKTSGPMTALVCLFIWWSFKREIRLGRRLDEVNDRHEEYLTTIIKENTEALNTVAEAVRDLRRS